MKTPWLPLYPGDYLRDTMGLTTEQHGAYMLLIMAYWSSGGPLPDDDQFLASVTRLPIDRWISCRPVMQTFFTIEPIAIAIANGIANGIAKSQWRHGRIDAELQRTSKIREIRSEIGRKGVEKRWKDSNCYSNRYSKRYSKTILSTTTTTDNTTSTTKGVPGDAPDAAIPTKEEVITYGDMHGVPKDVCIALWEHHKGNNSWLNEHGRIKNWRVKLTQWAARKREPVVASNVIVKDGQPKKSWDSNSRNEVIEIKKF